MSSKQSGRNDDKTLQQLESDDWGLCTSDSAIIQRLFQVRQKPLKLLDATDFRIAIHFGVGLAHVIPRALDELWSDPWLSSGNYPGDLLEAVLRSNAEFYAKHLDCCRRAVDIAADAKRVYDVMDVAAQQASGVDDVSYNRLDKAMAELVAICASVS
jgi:hypothetical protein